MPIDELLITALPSDVRAAAFEDGRLVRFVWSGGDDGLRPGDVLAGRLLKRAPGVGGAFVELGRDPVGLLMFADAPPGPAFAEGDLLIVRVLREADGTKGPKLSARLPQALREAALRAAETTCAAAPAPTGRPLLRGPDPLEALLREAAPSVRRVLVDDPEIAARLRRAVPQAGDRLQVWLDPRPLFAARDVDGALEAALAPELLLPCGGRVTIEETAALTAIDVDSGRIGDSQPNVAALVCDVEAATEIGRQIRLRDLAGTIVIDFLPLRRPGDRSQVLAALTAALAGDDRVRRMGGWTRLGLVELSRERRGPSLTRRISARCEACAGSGRAVDPRFAAGAGLRAVAAAALHAPDAAPALRLTPAVAAALRGPLAAACRHVEQRLGRPLALLEDERVPAPGYALVHRKSEDEGGR